MASGAADATDDATEAEEGEADAGAACGAAAGVSVQMFELDVSARLLNASEGARVAFRVYPTRSAATRAEAAEPDRCVFVFGVELRRQSDGAGGSDVMRPSGCLGTHARRARAHRDAVMPQRRVTLRFR